MTPQIIHPRPNPIVAAMYTLRDMDVDVIVTHGPAGCCFMASRPLENAGVKVVTSALKDSDLIFGGTDSLVRTLKEAQSKFAPRTMAVVGTCASTIIGDDIAAAIRRAELGSDCKCFAVDCSGCLADNTQGAIRAIKAGAKVGIIDEAERDRQIQLLKAATDLEKQRGMAAKAYLSPAVSPTKLHVAKLIANAFKEKKKVAVVMLAKKELAYRFADMFLAVDEAKKKFGGETLYVANLDGTCGLPRIRRYCSDITSELNAKGVVIDESVGGLDEYAILGDKAKDAVDRFMPDVKIIVGICHAYPDIGKEDILVTDQPRQFANYLEQGFEHSVCEIASHNMVMGATGIIHLETADTLREIVEDE